MPFGGVGFIRLNYDVIYNEKACNCQEKKEKKKQASEFRFFLVAAQADRSKAFSPVKRRIGLVNLL